MKKVLTFLFLSIFIISCSQKSSQDIEWIPFNWVSYTISDRTFEKAAMNIPVTIDDLPYKFTMQFDMGAATETNFYGNTLAPFLEKYPSLNNKLDMTKKFCIQSQEHPMFRNVNLQLGEVVFKNLDVGLFTNYGDELSLDTINSETEIHIGTISSTFVKGKIVIIDYKLNRLAITDTLPPEYQNASFESFIADNGLVKIPFRINEKIEHFLFDTGASIFSLTTTKQNALTISEPEIVDSLSVPSWGEYITLYGLKTVSPIKFGNKTMESAIVYYEDKSSDDYDFYKAENIWGLTGNAYFLNNVVIIDYKNKRFGVK